MFLIPTGVFNTAELLINQLGLTPGVSHGDFNGLQLLLNAFVDLKVADSTTLRLGRQELLYGNQRLVSPLDWANTRRTFDGYRLLFSGNAWDIDGFYTHPVDRVAANVDRWDSADTAQDFYGVYATRKGLEIGWAAARAAEREAAVTAQLVALPEGARIPRAVSRITGVREEDLAEAISAEEALAVMSMEECWEAILAMGPPEEVGGPARGIGGPEQLQKPVTTCCCVERLFKLILRVKQFRKIFTTLCCFYNTVL